MMMSITDSCLPAFNENWAVLHMTPMKMRGITPGLAVCV
jgi:hypothetical protein